MAELVTGPYLRTARNWRPSRATIIWSVSTLLLSLLTLAAFLGLERLEPVPIPWPADRDFAALAAGAPVAGQGWEIEGDPAKVAVADGVLRLHNDDPGSSVGVRQVFRLGPGDPRVFTLGAVASGRAIERGGRGHYIGEVTLVADGDIGRRRFTSLHRLTGMRGDRGQERFTHQFRFPSDASRVELAIRLRNATGTISVAQLRLTGFVEKASFAWVRRVLTAAWAVSLLVGAGLFWRGVTLRRTGLALLAASGAGLVLLLLPHGPREALLQPFGHLVPGMRLGSETTAMMGHVSVFAAVGLLMRLLQRREPWPAQLVLLLALAGMTELLQFMAELRTPSLDDWLANGCGALIGWAAASSLLLLLARGPAPGQAPSSTTLPPQAAKQRR